MSREQAKAILEKLVNRFNEQRNSYHSADYNETKTRRDFIDPLFKAFGWDIDNEQDVAEPYREVIHEDKIKIQGKTKAPDYGFRLPGSKDRLFFIEAKKPSVNLKTNKEAAFQVRRYGWNSGAAISILTNFEEFVIYDCSKKPNSSESSAVARLKYFTYNDYLIEFDFIYDVFSREAVLKDRFAKYVKSDTAKKGTQTPDKEFVESLDKWRRYIAIDIAKSNLKINEDELNFAVQLIIDRLIFLRFCEDRGVETYGQLKSATSKGDAYKNLCAVFIDADNKYNSGLFDFKKDKITQDLKVTNKIIKGIIEDLYYPKSEYDFKALPVEVLGNAYEQFLGKVISINKAHHAVIDVKPEVRKAGGVYYTPQYIVDYIVENTIGKLIKGKTPKEIEKIKIVDPACGSGSFLLGAFQYLLNFHADYYHKNGYTNKKGKDNPLTPFGTLSTAEKKKILVNNIYGVDIDANAVEVTKLSLLLKCMEGETDASIKHQQEMFHDRVLPDVDNNIKAGNSLIDIDFYENEIDFGFEKEVKPFSWKKTFPEIFKQGGFDIVIGNPPYGYMISKEQQQYFEKFYHNQDYQKDLYLLFLERFKYILKDQGDLGVIISNTWLQSITLRKIRSYLLNTYKWERILLLPEKVFKAVVDTHVIIFKKETPNISSSFEVDILRSNKISTLHSLKQKEISANGDAINVSVNNTAKFLYKKIISGKKNLSSLAIVYNGVKPFEKGKGKPPQTEKVLKEKPYVAEGKRPDKKWSPLLRGSLINRYINLWNEDYWILYGEWLAAPRDPKIFSHKETIMVRQTGDSLIATIIPKGFIARNNLHVIISQNINMKYILGIINSKLMDFVYTYINPEKGEALAEVKKQHLEALPIKEIDQKNNSEKSKQEEIIKHVDILLKLNEEFKDEKLQNNLVQLQQRIKYSEEKINQMVYELYKLTPVEIKIIEEGVI